MLLNRTHSFILIIFSMFSAFFIPTLSAMGMGVIDFIKQAETRVVQDFRGNIVPPDIQENLETLHNANSTLARGLALYELSKSFEIRYLPTLLGYSDRLHATNLERLTLYNNTEYPNLPEMARRIGLNPEDIYVNERRETRTGYETATATRTFTKKIILINSIVENNSPSSHKNQITFTHGERLFMIGRELSRIAHEHLLKRIALNLLFPWVMHGALIISNALISLSLQTISRKFDAISSDKLSNMLGITHFLLRNPLMESIYINRICTYASKIREKQADIESARTFNCADAGVSLYQKIDAHDKQKYSRLRRIYRWFKGTGPTHAERIEYLQKIATMA